MPRPLASAGPISQQRQDPRLSPLPLGSIVIIFFQAVLTIARLSKAKWRRTIRAKSW